MLVWQFDTVMRPKVKPERGQGPEMVAAERVVVRARAAAVTKCNIFNE
jgi:hypothetical protein